MRYRREKIGERYYFRESTKVTEVPNTEVIDLTEEEFNCTKCDLSFNSKKSLAGHKGWHTKQENLIISPKNNTTVKKKKRITSLLKTKVWDAYPNNNFCYCCNKVPIRESNFEAGHVLSEANGGKLSVFNLRPICSQCNKSMGTEHMFDYMKRSDCIRIPEDVRDKKEFDNSWKILIDNYEELKNIYKLDNMFTKSISEDLGEYYLSKPLKKLDNIKEKFNNISIAKINKAFSNEQVNDKLIQKIQIKLLIHKLINSKQQKLKFFKLYLKNNGMPYGNIINKIGEKFNFLYEDDFLSNKVDFTNEVGDKFYLMYDVLFYTINIYL